MDPKESVPLYSKEPSQLSSFFKENGTYMWATIGILLFCNLLYLNFKSFFPEPQAQQFIAQAPQGSTLVFPTQSPSYCPAACITEIISSTASAGIKAVVSGGITPTSSPTPTQTPTPTPTPTSSPNEYFVPLGYGSGNYTTFTSIPGLGVTLNPANYPSISSVTFEATVWIPTGNQTVWVQLYNANTFQTVNNSQMTVIGSVPTLVVTPISLALGNNFYQVQLNTQLGYTTYIQQARIRIQTN